MVKLKSETKQAAMSSSLKKNSKQKSKSKKISGANITNRSALSKKSSKNKKRSCLVKNKKLSENGSATTKLKRTDKDSSKSTKRSITRKLKKKDKENSKSSKCSTTNKLKRANKDSSRSSKRSATKKLLKVGKEKSKKSNRSATTKLKRVQMEKSKKSNCSSTTTKKVGKDKSNKSNRSKTTKMKKKAKLSGRTTVTSKIKNANNKEKSNLTKKASNRSQTSKLKTANNKSKSKASKKTKKLNKTEDLEKTKVANRSATKKLNKTEDVEKTKVANRSATKKQNKTENQEKTKDKIEDSNKSKTEQNPTEPETKKVPKNVTKNKENCLGKLVDTSSPQVLPIIKFQKGKQAPKSNSKDIKLKLPRIFFELSLQKGRNHECNGPMCNHCEDSNSDNESISMFTIYHKTLSSKSTKNNTQSRFDNRHTVCTINRLTFCSIILFISTLFVLLVSSLLFKEFESYKMNQNIADGHNYYRSLCGVPLLQVDIGLMNIAKLHSRQKKPDKQEKHKSNQTKRINRNETRKIFDEIEYVKSSLGRTQIFQSFVTKKFEINGYDVSDQFYLGVDAYDYDNNRCQFNQSGDFCNKFTQMIWKATRYIGCYDKVTGQNQLHDGWTRYDVLITCQYYPKGNIPTQYHDNVFRIKRN